MPRYIVQTVVRCHGGGTARERFEEDADDKDAAARTVRAYLRMQGADIESVETIGVRGDF